MANRPSPQPDDPAQQDDLAAADATDLHRSVRLEGEAELDRSGAALIWSGVAAGIAINSTLLAQGAIAARLPDAPWAPLVTALGYPIGFLIVILGRMELFTESTITAMLPFATRPSLRAAIRTLRLWSYVILANLIGTAIAAGATTLGLVDTEHMMRAMIKIASKTMELGPLPTFVNAIPAGFLIAIIAWILPSSREQSFWIIGALTYLVGIAGFSHSIVGSDEVFLLIFNGAAGPSLILGSIVPALLGNLVGGAGIFALLAHAQVRSDAHARARESEAGSGGRDRDGADPD